MCEDQEADIDDAYILKHILRFPHPNSTPNMSLPSAIRAGSALLRPRANLSALTRALTTMTPTPTSTVGNLGPGTEKRFVRIAGASSYATRHDLELFLESHDVERPPSPSPHDLVQGQSDIFQNQAIWIFDAGNAEAASAVAGRISGRVAGMKLVRAAAVDQRVVDDLLAVPGRTRTGASKPSLRKRMNVIQPMTEERGRALLVTNLPFSLPARFLWSFFAAYEIVAIRHLRKSGVASVIFATEEEAARALRERANLPIQNSKSLIGLKAHD